MVHPENEYFLYSENDLPCENTREIMPKGIPALPDFTG